MHTVSIFNDVIGPVMRGPSSSHCAAALRIGRLARDLMQGDFNRVLIEFDRSGSLPLTHASQGSDMGLFGGLLGWDADDERLPESAVALREAGVTVEFKTIDVGDPHPNTYRLTLGNANESHQLIAISTGGGMIEVISIDGFSVSMDGGYHETLLKTTEELELNIDGCNTICHESNGEFLWQIQAQHFVELSSLSVSTSELPVWHRTLSPVLPVPTREDLRVPFRSCKELLEYDSDRKTPLWELAVAYECARSGFTEERVISEMSRIVRVLRRSIASGLAGTYYEDRVLGFQSGRFASKLASGQLLDAGALNSIILYVTALMEVKSSMGVIVAAPTAGACAALPGAVIAMAESLEQDEEAMVRAMLAAGLIGVFIATRWTFAAEVGGCQAEGGAAACMAAAALTTLAGGSRDQCISASSLAFQSMLGLICDPIANRVEAPCLGKNVMAAANALSCANMALADFDALIPLDEVIDAAKAVAEKMPREHRCTSLGGLAATPTSKQIEKRLHQIAAQHEPTKSCGSGGCCG